MTDVATPSQDPLAALRKDYASGTLDETAVDPDPFTQFERWFAEALATQSGETNAMMLATVSADGRPSARMVLLKGVDPPIPEAPSAEPGPPTSRSLVAKPLPEPSKTRSTDLDSVPADQSTPSERGFVFFTHYASRKGKELTASPFAALVFWWPALSRQVRVEGRVERVSSAESDAYFASRPRRSRLAAIASPQSQVLPHRELLDARMAALEAQFGTTPEDDATGPSVPRPTTWGGFRVIPTVIEFWQGRPSRLHDRLRYRRIEHAPTASTAEAAATAQTAATAQAAASRASEGGSGEGVGGESRTSEGGTGGGGSGDSADARWVVERLAP